MKKLLSLVLFVALVGLCSAQVVTVGVRKDTYVNPSLSSTVVQASSLYNTLQVVSIYNPSAAVAYVQFFDVSSPTLVNLGVTPPKYVIAVPTVSAVNFALPPGMTFTQGICISATTTPTGSTGPATALVISLLSNNTRVD